MLALRPRVMILPLLALALALGACNGADSPLAPSGDPAAPDDLLAVATTQRIVFTSYRYGNGDLYKMDPQGSSLTRLTSSTLNERTAAWSHDNKRLALVRQRPTAANPYNSDIWVINADGSNGHWARSEPSPWPLTDPSWSADGSRLALCLLVNGVSQVGWLNLATGQLSLFNEAAGGQPGRQPSYDATGQKLVYVSFFGTRIEQIKADGSGRKVLVSSASPTALLNSPRYSPDGKRIAYSKVVTAGNEEIFVKNLVDGTVKRLTSSAGQDAQPTWSPDGAKIAFVSQRSGQYQIWTMTSTGGSPLRITHTASEEWDPAWSH
jgi:TolB protein